METGRAARSPHRRAAARKRGSVHQRERYLAAFAIGHRQRFDRRHRPHPAACRKAGAPLRAARGRGRNGGMAAERDPRGPRRRRRVPAARRPGEVSLPGSRRRRVPRQRAAARRHGRRCPEAGGRWLGRARRGLAAAARHRCRPAVRAAEHDDHRAARHDQRYCASARRWRASPISATTRHWK